VSDPIDAIEVYLRCDAGADHGLGHLSRCLSLADALEEQGINAPVFVTHAPDESVSNVIEKRGYEHWQSPERAGGLKDLAFLTTLLRKARKRSRLPPVAVLDSKEIEAPYAARCDREAYLLCFDDEVARDLPCDLLLNNNVWASEESYPGRDGRRVLAGLTYNLVPKVFFRQGDSDIGPEDRLSVLITLGGEDPHNHTQWLLEHLGDLLTQHRVTVITGPAHPDPAAVQLTARARLPHAEVVRAPATLAPFVGRADVAITAGGTTCYELAAARIAQAAIVVEDHQWPLVTAMEESGCLVLLGSYADLEIAQARATLERLLNSADTRAQMAQAAKDLLPESGRQLVARSLIEGYLAARQLPEDRHAAPLGKA